MSELDLPFSDEWLAVVEKPAGLVVHPAPGHHGDTLAEILSDQLGGGEEGRRGIVHRLDRGTSGLMVVARREDAHSALSAMIAGRQIKRIYTALIEGRPRARSGTIDAPLGRDHRTRERRAVGGGGAREARTHYEVVEVLVADTLVEARLETGRTHQIRVHFEAIGHPLAGDPTYGSAGRHGLERQFLHSSRLAFHHPMTGETIDLSSPLPEDLEQALSRAREPNVP